MPADGVGASTAEQRALRTSIWVSVVLAVISVVWGLLARSEVILLDAVFMPLYVFLAAGSLIVSRLVAGGPSGTFPFGRNALVPLFVIAQSIILIGALAYAVLEAVRVILAGGTGVSGVTLLAYGLFSGLVSLITWRLLLRMGRDRPLVEAEAAGWFSAVPSSAVVAVGGAVVLLLGDTRLAAVAPYVDPVLVIIVSLGLLVIPVGLLRRSIRDLQTARPDAELVAQVESVVENVRATERLPEPILRVGRIGAILDIALTFVLTPGTGDIAGEDRVRRGVRDGLGHLPYGVWITVEFGYDAELFERQ